MAAVVVLGAGVCGLATALLLQRDGHEVTVLERDREPVPESVDRAWEDWDRRGVAQFRQAHYLHPRLRHLLDDELPDLRDALLAAGATRFDTLTAAPPTVPPLDRRPDDDRFVGLTARRATLEQVVARLAEDEPGLRIERGVDVTGLVVGRLDGIAHVTGVRTHDERVISGDLVVDATGRRSPLPRWLQEAGCGPLPEEAVDAGFTYYTRFFRSRGAGLPEPREALNTQMGSFAVLTLPGDRDTWAVTLYAASHDQPLKELRHEEIWSSVLSACPLHEHWLDGEALTGVLPMAGQLGRYRRPVADGRPVLTGLAMVADAWACTNPSLGRGITLGLMHAIALRNVLRTAPDDPRSFAEAWDDATETTLTPWYRATVDIDRARLAQIDALREGRTPQTPQGPATLAAAFAGASRYDPEVFRAFAEVVSCHALPRDVLSRPGLADRVQQVAAERPPAPPPGPDRQHLMRLLSGERVGS